MKHVLAIAVVVAARSAAAGGPPERFRVGFDVGLHLGDQAGPVLGIDGELPLGPIALRACIQRGWLRPTASYQWYDEEDDTADDWRATAGVELRSGAGESGTSAFIGLGGGVMRVSGGFLIDQTTYSPTGLVHFGLDLRSEHVRFRPELAAGAWRVPAIPPYYPVHVNRFAELSLGVDVVF